jgi:hypothetical protein
MISNIKWALLTPGIRVLLKKVIVVRLVMKFLAFCVTQRLVTMHPKNPPLIAILSQTETYSTFNIIT